MAAVLSVVRWSMPNWLDWPYRMNGKVWSSTAQSVRVDDLEELDIGIQAIAAIPVSAARKVLEKAMYASTLAV